MAYGRIKPAFSQLRFTQCRGPRVQPGFERINYAVKHAVAQLDDLGDQPALWAAMDVEDPGALAVHRYRLVAAQGEAFIGYADIIELHHPDYLDTGRLADLFDATPGSLPDDTRALLDQALAALARR